MRVLAFDPGYERLGAAVAERQNGKDILLHSDCIRTPAALSFPERMRSLGEACETLIRTWGPDAVALEEVYFEKNAKTAMQIAEVRGMLTYIAAHKGLPVFGYTPSEVKIAITGYGKSDKASVSAMVARLVGLPGKKRLDDEVDAIAVALTCLASARYPHQE